MTCHVVVGNITWQNLRVMSLLDVSLSVASGQVLVGAFALFVIASEWLSQRRRERDSQYYLISACLIGVVSLTLAAFSGLWSANITLFGSSTGSTRSELSGLHGVISCCRLRGSDRRCCCFRWAIVLLTRCRSRSRGKPRCSHMRRFARSPRSLVRDTSAARCLRSH